MTLAHPAGATGDAVVALGMGLLVAAWVAGVIVRGRAVVGPARRALAVAGFVALATALLGPLERAAETSLVAHMAQHILLVFVAAPLLVAGRAHVPLLFLFPAGARRLFFGILVGRRWLAVAAAWSLYAVVLWGWHLPGPYQAAIARPGIHAVEHAGFLGAGLLLWGLIAGRRRVDPGVGAVVVFTTMLHGVWLALAFTFLDSVIYPIYAHHAHPFGLSTLQDQQVAGVMLWLAGVSVWLGALGAILARWWRTLPRSERVRVEVPT